MMNPVTILVVDDEDFIATSIAKALKKQGYSVILTSDFASSIKVINSGEIDLVVSDVMLPFTGGIDIAEHIKTSSKLKHIPVILVTGMDRLILEGSHVQADEIITKPFEMVKLVESVNTHLKDKSLKNA
ncbi:MAG: response regulator [Bacteroidota bacterium]